MSPSTGEKFLEELDVKIAGQPFRPDITGFKSGDALEARVSDEAFSKYGGFYVIRTPLAEYLPDYKAIQRRNGQIIDLGIIPTLIFNGVQSVEFQLDDNTLYDIWYVHSSRFDPVRITTGDGQMPHRSTLDEVHLMMLLRAGIKPEEAEGVHATIIHDSNLLRNRREFLYMGLQVGEVVASISTQSSFGMNYAIRKGDISEDFLAKATSETVATQIRRLKINWPSFSQLYTLLYIFKNLYGENK